MEQAAGGQGADLAVSDALLRAALDGLPLAVFVLDEDVRIRLVNAEAEALLGSEGDVMLRRFGHALHCLHERDNEAGCGHGAACADCVIRNGVGSCLALGRPLREKTRLERRTTEGVSVRAYAISAAPLPVPGEQALALLTLQDITELTALREVVPICASCHRVRSGANYWQTVERFLADQHAIGWSHGLCDDCRAQFVPSRKAP